MAGKIIISNPSGGTPGGNDKEVQFNDAGSFGGGATLYWDRASGRLGIGLNNPSDLLSISDGNRCLSFGIDGQDVDCDVQAQSFVFQAANVDSANEPMRIKVKPKGNDYTSFMMRGYGSEIGELTTYGGRFTFTSRAGFETSINYDVAENVSIWKTIAGGNPYFEIYGRNAANTDNDYVKMRMGTGAIDAFVVDVFDSDDVARHPILLNPSGGNVGINTTTINEALNVGGAIRLGTSALTNNGAIRWTGTDFEGYMTGWKSLTGSDDYSNFTYTFYKSGSTYYAKANTVSGKSSYSGANCHTVLQSAIDAIGTDGGSICFAEDTYNFTGQVVGDHDIKFVGCGMPWGDHGTYFELDANIDMFKFTSKHCFSFEHITFDGNNRNNKVLWFYGTGSAGASACHNIHLTKCHFKNCRQAIYGNYAYDLWLTDVNLWDCGYQTTYDACHADAGCNTWHMKSCRWEGLSGRAFRSVKGGAANEAFVFLDCKFHGWTGNKYDAIYGDLYHSRITNCFFYDTGASYCGIHLTNDDNIIANNNFLGHDGTAIILNSDNNVVDSNIFMTAASVTHIDDNGTNNSILGNHRGSTDSNNLLDYAGATTEKRLFNDGEVDSHIIKSSGTQTITNGNEWLPGAGTYNMTTSGCKLGLYADGAWRWGSGYGFAGTVFCDGTNMKTKNDSGSTQYVFWQKF
jgi:hypothetical protein